MSMSMPKIKAMKTSIKTPKIAMPKLNFVSKPIIGSSYKPKGVKTKISLK